MRNFFKKTVCQHGDWEGRGFSYVKCGKCGVVKYDPSKCATINNAFISKMVGSGVWDAAEVNRRGARHGITVKPTNEPVEGL